MNWENGIETSTVPCAKHISSVNVMMDTGHLKPVLWDNLNGWGEEGGGRGFGMGGHVCTYGRFVLTYGENHHNIVK